jgi:hypothetical protein
MDDRHAVELRYRDFWRRYMLVRTAPKPGDGAWEDGIREPVQFWEHHATVTLESVDLEGEYPHTTLAIVFHRIGRPECRYAWRYPVWINGTLDPEPGVGDPDDVWVPFLEWIDLAFRPADLPCSSDPVAANPPNPWRPDASER